MLQSVFCNRIHCCDLCSSTIMAIFPLPHQEYKKLSFGSVSTEFLFAAAIRLADSEPQTLGGQLHSATKGNPDNSRNCLSGPCQSGRQAKITGGPDRGGGGGDADHPPPPRLVIGLDTVSWADAGAALSAARGDGYDYVTTRIPNSNTTTTKSSNNVVVRTDVTTLGSKWWRTSVVGVVDMSENQTTAGDTSSSSSMYATTYYIPVGVGMELAHELAGGTRASLADGWYE
jgi:hypothetical protein